MILGICGSLRAKSLNRMVLQALQTKLPEIHIWDGLAGIQPFNPDDEGTEGEPVHEFRRLLRASRVVIIASPEYAHGVTGVMKNALDWVVGSGEFMKKPTVVVNCSHQATIANAALRETLSVMEAHILPFTVPLASHGMTVDKILADEALSEKLDEITMALKSW
ncbi:MAG: NAD(P)H-dependent oxidoreductase [Armatimonadetes bacterium]|nr:NAD(P)H-dependent oxidoreductase [Armatimonadota bacterium]